MKPYSTNILQPVEIMLLGSAPLSLPPLIFIEY